MSKGTASMGKKGGKKTHIHCRRCGLRTYHMRKQRCSSCGFGATATKKKIYLAKEVEFTILK